MTTRAIVLFLTLLGLPLSAQAQRCNLVAVVTDDQARWAMGAYGNRECRTPHMDRLARDGARFLNAFVPTPVCSPSRASYMTGLYGTQVGITDFLAPEEAAAGAGLPTRFTIWPRVLQQTGYTTGLIGKWHLGTKPRYHPTKHGLTHFEGSLHGSFRPVDPTWEVAGKETVLRGQAADLTGAAALRFLDANRSRPFALLVHFREPHAPYEPMRDVDTAPFRMLDPTIPAVAGLDVPQVKQWYRDYYASVHAIDRNLGRILGKLDELKLRERTIVVFTSDHGYMLGHHGLRHKGNAHWYIGGARGPKRPNMFEESIRVPLLVRWPGVVKPGAEIAEPVTNLDMFASVLSMLGVEAPAGVKTEGKDFSPLLRGKKIPWRDTLFGQYDLHNGGLAYMRMIRTPRWKLVRHLRANGLDELYDLHNDPGELKNLYRNAKQVKTRASLEQQLTAWMKSIDDPLLGDIAGRDNPR
jgi:uncharacterized sulfatase